MNCRVCGSGEHEETYSLFASVLPLVVCPNVSEGTYLFVPSGGMREDRPLVPDLLDKERDDSAE